MKSDGNGGPPVLPRPPVDGGPNSKNPSFKGLTPASEQSSRVKRANRKRDTRAELLLRRELWRLGLRYRTHVSWLPGIPDVVFTRARVVVFCDGDFWHGRYWETLKPKLERGSNPGYWSAKIARNIERDRATDARLRELGWRIVRLWETDIISDPAAAAGSVRAILDGALRTRDRRVPHE